MFRNFTVLNTIGRAAAALCEDLLPSLMVMLVTLSAGAWVVGVRIDIDMLINTHP